MKLTTAGEEKDSVVDTTNEVFMLIFSIFIMYSTPSDVGAVLQWNVYISIYTNFILQVL